MIGILEGFINAPVRARRLVPALVLGSLFAFVTACSTPGVATPVAAGDANAALAKVGGAVITLEDVNNHAASELAALRRQEYEIKRKALDDLIDEKIVEQEAAAQKISKEDLLKREVTDKVGEPTDDEMRMVFEMNKGRIGDTPYEQVKPKIHDFMMQRKGEDARNAYLTGLKSKAKVEDNFQPPRAEVSADDDAFKGPKDAPITIIMFSDYQCPYCSHAEEVVGQVMTKYDGKVKLVFRDFPLEFHENAKGAAMASECAREKGKYWEMHEAMFKDQSKLDSASLVATAVGLGLDAAEFKGCIDNKKFEKEVDKDQADGKKLGVTGTPAFFINGILLEGAQPIEEFSKVIDAELARAGK